VIRPPFLVPFAVAFVVLLAACKENLSEPPPTGSGPDTSPPVVSASPGLDTLVDSTGVLLIHVRASDRSAIKLIEVTLTPPLFAFEPFNPSDTLVIASFPVQLSLYKHTTFTYSVRAVDVLDHSVDTPPVTVTVR